MPSLVVSDVIISNPPIKKRGMRSFLFRPLDGEAGDAGAVAARPESVARCPAAVGSSQVGDAAARLQLSGRPCGGHVVATSRLVFRARVRRSVTVRVRAAPCGASSVRVLLWSFCLGFCVVRAPLFRCHRHRIDAAFGTCLGGACFLFWPCACGRPRASSVPGAVSRP